VGFCGRVAQHGHRDKHEILIYILIGIVRKAYDTNIKRTDGGRVKIILLQDEKKLGKKGDIIEASDGYARNYIIPKKIGMEATPKNLNDLKLQKQSQERKAQEMLNAARTMAELLETKEVHVGIETGEGGRTFGSVSSKEIAAAYLEQHGIEWDKKKMLLTKNLKSIGTYEVPLKLHPQVAAKLTVKVVEA
jgi:large subunit ribosomal protein L9